MEGKSDYIMNMYAKPAYRNKGVASFLFVKILEEARKLGYKNISLNATDMGKPLYLKYGFKDTGNEMILNL